MPHQFIKDLKPGQRVEDEVYLIQSRDLRTTTQGGLYIHAVLADRTGQLVARHWQATEDMYREMTESRFMRFKGRAENYKGHLQFIIDGMQPAAEEAVTISDFLPSTSKDVDEMFKRMVSILAAVKHPDLRALVDAFLADADLMARFRRAPAATTMHHAYIGGLLEHTLNLLELAQRVVPLYPRLNLELVLAGLFLHDIGKAHELVFDTHIGYSDRGQLVGHIVLCAQWIAEKAAELGKARGKPFPEDLLSVLQHIVLSHHGQYAFGSPKLPAIPEAIAIHHLDNLDAKVNQFLQEIDKDPAGENWTPYQRSLETKIYRRDVTETQPRPENGRSGAQET